MAGATILCVRVEYRKARGKRVLLSRDERVASAAGEFVRALAQRRSAGALSEMR